MSSIVIYTTRYCPFCVRAKQLLQQELNGTNIRFREIPVDNDQKLRQEMMQKSGRRTVPQIWIGENHVGGCDDLFDLKSSGQLKKMLLAAK